MYSLKVENNKGDSIDLSASQNYTLFKVEGLAPPAASLATTENSVSDGGVINSARVGFRNLVLYMTIDGDVEKNRIALYKYFPLKKRVTVYYKNGTRDVYIEGMVEVIEVDHFERRQQAQVSIICEQPYFKAVDDLVTTFSDNEAAFEFPFSIESSGVEISRIVSDVRRSIVNIGDVDTGVVIELFSLGEVKNPVIYEINNNLKMKLNFTMKQGDLITIDTRTGKKSIMLTRDGTTTNALGYLSQDSGWIIMEPGENTFTYDVDDGGELLQVTFKTPVLYAGV